MSRPRRRPGAGRARAASPQSPGGEKPPAPGEEADRLKARWNAAKARRAAAVAGYKRIEAEYAARVRHAIDGVVVSRSVNAGETVDRAAPLLPDRRPETGWRSRPKIDEFDIPRCASGCKATITAPDIAASHGKGQSRRSPTAWSPVAFVPKTPAAPPTPASCRCELHSVAPRR